MKILFPNEHGAWGMFVASFLVGWLAARQDIVLCASCHERGTATNCIACHSTGVTTRSPHPPGWKSGLNRTTDPACRVCH